MMRFCKRSHVERNVEPKARRGRLWLGFAFGLALGISRTLVAAEGPPQAPPAENTTTATTTEAVSSDELEALVATLEDSAEREKLVKQLRALIEARRTVEPTATE